MSDSIEVKTAENDAKKTIAATEPLIHSALHNLLVGAKDEAEKLGLDIETEIKKLLGKL